MSLILSNSKSICNNPGNSYKMFVSYKRCKKNIEGFVMTLSFLLFVS